MFYTDFNAEVAKCIVHGYDFHVSFLEKNDLMPATVDLTFFNWRERRFTIASFYRNNMRLVCRVSADLSGQDILDLSSEFPNAKQWAPDKRSYLRKFLDRFSEKPKKA